MRSERPLRQNRDWNLLWAGDSVSSLGTGMAMFVYPLLGFELTGSVASASFVSSAFAVGWVGTKLLGGAIADRADLKSAMVRASMIGVTLSATLAATLAIGRITFLQLLITALLSGVNTSFYEPALAAAVRRVVPTTQLATAQSVNQARSSAAQLAGPPVGGLLYGLARWAPFLADAMSFVVFVFFARALKKSRLGPVPREGKTTVRADVAAGLRFVLLNPFFRGLLLFEALFNVASTAFFTALILGLFSSGLPAGLTGVVEAWVATVMLLGAIWATRLVQRVSMPRLFAIGSVTIPLGAIGVALSNTHLIAVAGFLVVMVALIAPMNASVAGYASRITPVEMQGRMSAGTMFVASVLQPFGPVLGGGLLATLGQRTALFSLAGGLLVAVVPLLVSRAFWRVGTPDTWDELPVN